MKRLLRWALLLPLLLGLMLSGAQAGYVDCTGNPLTDNWVAEGFSTAVGTFIRNYDNAMWSFNVYTTSFTLTAGNPLIGGSWQAGDLILGLGGVMNPNTQDFSPRLVAKFGATDATFKPATDLTSGDGIGSFSGGAAGVGGVQVDFSYSRNNGVLPPGVNGVLQTPDHVLWNKNQSLSTGYGKVSALFETDGSNHDILQSFEVLLDVNAISDQTRGNKGALVPVLHGKGDMAVQQGSSGYTDAYVQDVGAAHTPIPGSLALLATGLVGLGLLGRRKFFKH